MLQKHFSFKLFIKGFSNCEWPCPNYFELFKLHCENTNKFVSPDFILKRTIS